MIAKRKYSSTIGKLKESGWILEDWTNDNQYNEEPVIITEYDNYLYIDFPMLDSDNNMILKGKHNLEGLTLEEEYVEKRRNRYIN